MKILTLLLISLFLTFSVSGQDKSTETSAEQTSLRVEIEGGSSIDVKGADLAKLPRREVRAKDHDGKESIYEGVDLREVVKLAGAKIGNNQMRGKELANYLLVEAADGYKAVFALPELDAEFTDKIILLAEKRDGKPLSGNEGRLRLVVPDEKKHARWVRQVVALKVKKAQ